MRITLNSLSKLYGSNPNIHRGCVVDTNALFATSMPLDRLNEWAESTFSQMHELGISVYTNINIRSEFMELQRRVLIPEGLVSLYDIAEKHSMHPELRRQLKSLKTSKDEAALAGKLFKFNDQQLKKYRRLLIEMPGISAANGWEQFCEDYFLPYIQDVWENTIKDLNIQPTGTRAIESRKDFDHDLDWKDMTDIIGRFGIGSADAMIINFFLCSKFPVIVTSDEDVAYVVERLSKGEKYVLVPTVEDESLQSKISALE